MSAPTDLHTFINQLESCDELSRVACEVDPYLEAASIINKVCKFPGGGKALLFKNIKGSSIPLAANLFGSMQRMALCFGVEDISSIAKKITRELSEYREISSEQALKKIVSNSVNNITQTEHVISHDHIDSRLSELPALHSWPGDGGKYLTLAQIFTSMPGSHSQNCGMYRIQVINDNRALLRCYPGSGCARHLHAWHELDEPMPISVVLGGMPALTWAAGVSLPENIEETDFVAWLTGKPVSMQKCTMSDLKIPTEVEIIIEGLINPGEELLEGPFGNHTGYYSDKTLAPVIDVNSVKIRKEGIYPCTVVGPPPMENICLARTTERVMLQLLKHDCPWVVDVHMPLETIFHKIAFIKIAKSCKLETVEISSCLNRSLLLRNGKMKILFDEDVFIEDLNHVYWNVVNKKIAFGELDNTIIDARTSTGQTRIKPSDDILAQIEARSRDFDI